jgi:3-dehydroquinate dehydratase
VHEGGRNAENSLAARHQPEHVRQAGPGSLRHGYAADIYDATEALGKELGVEVENYQTNDEGAMCQKIHQAHTDKVDAVMINAGA